MSFYPHGFVADTAWQRENVSQMQRADYLLLRYGPASFAEWDSATRGYVLSHFALQVAHPDGRRPFELWRRMSPG